MGKKVSCIITTFNRPSLVLRAISSVLAQTYHNYEIIVVNDCSTVSYDYVTSLFKSIEKTQFINNSQNKGLSASRNVGISASSGDYVAFLDDDDFWFPTKLEEQIGALESNSNFVGCTSWHVESISKKEIGKNKEIFTIDDILLYNKIGPPSKMMIPMSIVKETLFNEDVTHAEDWDLYIRLLQKGNILNIRKPLIEYNTGHFERMTNQFHKLSFEQINKKAETTFLNKEVIGTENFNLRLADYYLNGFGKRPHKAKHFIDIVKIVGWLAAIRSIGIRIQRIALKKLT